MIYVFCGDDREKIAQEVAKVLGKGYEVFDGEELEVQGIMNIFQGASLFSETRRILIKDLTAPPLGSGSSSGSGDIRKKIDFYAEILPYANTKHTIVIWESNKSRKKSFKDFCKLKNVKVQDFIMAKPADAGKVFQVLDLAYRDGAAAVKIIEEIKDDNNPYMFMGLLTTQMLKKYSYGFSEKDKRVLKELSKLDIQMKSTSVEPWLLISAFIMRISSL